MSSGEALPMRLTPAVGFSDLGRVGRGGENLGDERVGVEGDGGDELLDLIGREGLLRLLRIAWGVLLIGRRLLLVGIGLRVLLLGLLRDLRVRLLLVRIRLVIGLRLRIAVRRLLLIGRRRGHLLRGEIHLRSGEEEQGEAESEDATQVLRDGLLWLKVEKKVWSAAGTCAAS